MKFDLVQYVHHEESFVAPGCFLVTFFQKRFVFVSLNTCSIEYSS